MSDPKDWIAISLLPRVGAVTLNRLYTEGWTPERLIDDHSSSPLRNIPNVPALLSAFLGEKGSLWDETHKCLEYLDAASIACIQPHSQDYPALLKETPDRPVLLFVQGDTEALTCPSIAIVGSRKPCAAGLRHAYQFSRALSEQGFVVTSGLALGVDGSAHQAAVDLRKPTLAVMGTGSHHLYPAKHRYLAQAILDNGGALITELLPDKGPIASHFPRRNRIISGMSLGVLVVEAAVKSGSLITARQALQQGREVFAIPGAIDHPGSRGCHALIREGATLVETVDQIVEELGSLLGAMVESGDQPESQPLRPLQGRVQAFPQSSELLSVNEDQSSLSDIQKTLLKAIGFAVTFLEELELPTSIDVGTQLSSELVELEMLGWIEPVGGGYRRVR